MFKVFTGVFAAALWFASSAQAAKVDPRLKELFRQSSSSQRVTVIALLEKQSALPTPRKYQRRQILQYLKRLNRDSVERVRNELLKHANIRQHITGISTRWINNSMSARVDRQGLRILAQTPGISKIYLQSKISYSRPTARQLVRRGATARVPYDFAETQLNRLISERPGVDGRGVVIGSVDTGVDAKHPALRGKIISFWDGKKGKKGRPYDSGSHGSHTIGTMVGGDHKRNPIGMAPKAKVVAAAALMGYDAMLQGMEFMLDPDGNPETNDAPRVVNNSWHSGGAPDQELFYKAISAWEAAGIVPVFSAGNRGPGEGTITHPKEHPATIAVGATAEHGKITRFSSRGPTDFRGRRIQKPDLTAPGNRILSTVPKGRMSKMSGTSMAAPHVAGAVALMLQVNPRLNPAQVKAILLRTAASRDESGQPQSEKKWNKVYGFGKLDIYAAVRAAAEMRGRQRHRRSPMRLAELDDFLSLDAFGWQMASFEEPAVETVDQALAFPKEYEGEWLDARDLF